MNPETKEINTTVDRIKKIKKQYSSIPRSVWDYVVYCEREYLQSASAQKRASKLTTQTGYKIGVEVVNGKYRIVVARSNF